jgi:hypothetical protein
MLRESLMSFASESPAPMRIVPTRRCRKVANVFPDESLTVPVTLIDHSGTQASEVPFVRLPRFSSTSFPSPMCRWSFLAARFGHTMSAKGA